ncbi:receptor-transporting protein 3-like [Scomber japonicus]|uniref:receptor-transporting protein 3-like n=1 Tax=Scomber japonicus TaxID=13676 RepID=UPI002306497F|nr:receptor-transporting protein 3-like [Scomber japonicus]
MAQEEWTRIFQIKTNDLRPEDSWHIEFDENLEPNRPNLGWNQYIRNTSARFECTKCGRSWPSNRVMVVFYMRLMDGQGVVKVRCYRQNCKKCNAAPMEEPSIESDNINILLEKLVEKIRIKCYHEDLGIISRPFRSFDVNNPHEPAHCEACIQGICTNNSN